MAKLRTMVSMELDDEEQLDAVMPLALDNRPEFPYGLKICLTSSEFGKLGIDPSDTQVGETFHLFGMARVTSVSMNDTAGGPCWRVEAQIEDMALESEDDENATDGY
jgi:hypothetical protein